MPDWDDRTDFRSHGTVPPDPPRGGQPRPFPPRSSEGAEPPATAPLPPEPPADREERKRERAHPELVIYSHSSLLYWWPVWLAGFVLAAFSYWEGQPHQIGEDRVWFHPSSNLGVIFFLTMFVVIVITNVSVRGLASAVVILSAILVSVLLVLYDLWDPILAWFGDLKIQLNVGAYFWFSALLFLVWVFTVFVFDRMSYWRVRPGQLTHEFVFGASAKSYDTENMVLEKHRDDIFRHWILGLGSGDLHIQPYGANKEEIPVPNVLFIGAKINAIERLIATEPEWPGRPQVK